MKKKEIDEFSKAITEHNWEELQRAKAACAAFLREDQRSIGFLFNSVSILAMVLRNSLEERLSERIGEVQEPLPLDELLGHIAEYCDVLEHVLGSDSESDDKTFH